MIGQAQKLAVYKKKRNPKVTPEPFGSKTSTPQLRFVIQKHQATALHYDFRLEIKGVMPSWAVPKGPSLDPKVKRLAMQTEDHPLDYQNFEGVIPEGEYGGGTVMIWDQGIYYPEKEVAVGKREQIKEKKTGDEVVFEALQKGELKFFLKGKKLRGSFALVKTKGFPGSKPNKPAWLLIKHKDEFIQEGYDINQQNFSVLSGKTFEEIKNR